jgi:hypothetical protein
LPRASLILRGVRADLRRREVRVKERPEHLWGRPVADPGIGYWDVVLRPLGSCQNSSVPSNPSVPRITSPGSGLLTSLPPEGEPSPELPRPRYPSRRTDPVLRVTASCSRPDVASGTSTFCFASLRPRAPGRSRPFPLDEAPGDAACRLTAWDVGQGKGPHRRSQYQLRNKDGSRESFSLFAIRSQSVRRVIRSFTVFAVDNARLLELVVCPSDPERARFGLRPEEGSGFYWPR